MGGNYRAAGQDKPAERSNNGSQRPHCGKRSLAPDRTEELKSSHQENESKREGDEDRRRGEAEEWSA